MKRVRRSRNPSKTKPMLTNAGLSSVCNLWLSIYEGRVQLREHSKSASGAAEQIVGRERRGGVSQLAWCGGGALILAAASTKTFDGFSIRGLNSRKPESPMIPRSQRTIGMT